MMLQFILILFDFFLLAYATLRCLRLVLIEKKRKRKIVGKSELFLLQILAFSYLFDSDLLPVVYFQLPFPVIPLEL